MPEHEIRSLADTPPVELVEVDPADAAEFPAGLDPDDHAADAEEADRG